jgi:hypothetical protein
VKKGLRYNIHENERKKKWIGYIPVKFEVHGCEGISHASVWIPAHSHASPEHFRETGIPGVVNSQ